MKNQNFGHIEGFPEGHTFTIVELKLRMLDSTNISQRLTATRILAMGIFSLAAPKNQMRLLADRLN